MKKVALIKADVNSGIGYLVKLLQRRYMDADIDLYSFDRQEEKFPQVNTIILGNIVDGLAKVKGEYTAAVLVYDKLYRLRALAGLIYVLKLKASEKQVHTPGGYHSDLNIYFLVRQVAKSLISVICIFLYAIIIFPLYLVERISGENG